MTVDALIDAWPLLLIATGLGLAMSLGLMTMVHFGTRHRLEWMGVYFVAVLGALVLGTIIQDRELRSLGDLATLGYDAPEMTDWVASSWVSRSITLLCLALAIERGARFILGREYLDAKGWVVLWTFMAYVLALNGLAAFFGTEPRFTHHLLYAPIVAFAVFAYAQRNGEACIHWVKWAILIFLAAAWFALLVRLPLVAETGYAEGLIPGFTMRLYGFATHPNTLAPLCFVLMCCLLLQPIAVRWLHRVAWFFASASLILTQSKTTIAVVAVALLWLFVVRYLRRARKESVARYRLARQIVFSWFVFAVGLLMSIALVAALMLPHFMVAASQLFEQQSVLTLTGRTSIWGATLNVIQQNWAFGYGPGLWGVEFRLRTGLFFTHAHNQYIHTLGAGGVAGLLGLFAFLVALCVGAWKVRRATMGTSVALAAYTVIRGFTEVPLGLSNALQTEFMVVMFLMVLVIHGLRVHSEPKLSTGMGWSLYRGRRSMVPRPA